MPTPSLDTIVVPIDFTETSLKALTVTVRLGQQQQANLYLVYVAEPTTTDRLAPESTASWEQLKAEGTARVQTLAMQTGERHGITCSATYRVGDLAQEVLNASQQAGAKLIVVGTRPGNDLIALQRATHAFQLVQTAPCPVLAIPAQREGFLFERILFPVRPVPGALDKYEAVRDLLLESGRAELIVLALFSPDEVISRHQLEEDISLLNSKLTRDGVKNRTEYCPTDLMAETVLEKVVEYNADLLVITAGPGEGSDALFTGSFARQMLRYAPCPILAIRPEGAVHLPGNRVIWHQGLTGSASTTPDP